MDAEAAMSRSALLVKTQLWQISLAAPVEAEAAAAAVLEEFSGKAPVTYTDANSQTAVLSVYLPKLPLPKSELRAKLRTGLKKVQEGELNIRTVRVLFRRIRNEDWTESWKRHFRALEIGRALLVQPSWSRRRPRSGQAVVVLDPGLSFGTGQHPTTAFCLEQLVAFRPVAQRKSLLDLGTGSGILAIAGAKLGFDPILALDLDPAAIRVARANAVQNGVERIVRVSQRDLTRLPLRSDVKFSVVCANLTDDLLLQQSKRILNRLVPGGTLILAGLLKSQFARVRRAYKSAGLRLLATGHDNEWQSGAFG